ncbi:hypothetical protein BH09ACT10_BH09ACT10_31140 [soil metagenome]
MRFDPAFEWGPAHHRDETNGSDLEPVERPDDN